MTPVARSARTRSDDVDGAAWTAVARSRLVCRASSCRARTRAWSSASSSVMTPFFRTSYGLVRRSWVFHYGPAMTTGQTAERCVIVVDAGLAPGLAANAAAVLAVTLGATVDGL